MFSKDKAKILARVGKLSYYVYLEINLPEVKGNGDLSILPFSVGFAFGNKFPYLKIGSNF